MGRYKKKNLCGPWFYTSGKIYATSIIDSFSDRIWNQIAWLEQLWDSRVEWQLLLSSGSPPPLPDTCATASAHRPMPCPFSLSGPVHLISHGSICWSKRYKL